MRPKTCSLRDWRCSCKTHRLPLKAASQEKLGQGRRPQRSRGVCDVPLWVFLKQQGGRREPVSCSLKAVVVVVVVVVARAGQSKQWQLIASKESNFVKLHTTSLVSAQNRRQNCVTHFPWRHNRKNKVSTFNQAQRSTIFHDRIQIKRFFCRTQ